MTTKTDKDDRTGRLNWGTRQSLTHFGWMSNTCFYDPCIYDYYVVVVGPITGDVQLHLSGDPYCNLSIDNEEVLTAYGGNTATMTVEMVEGDFYYMVIN